MAFHQYKDSPHRIKESDIGDYASHNDVHLKRQVRDNSRKDKVNMLKLNKQEKEYIEAYTGLDRLKRYIPASDYTDSLLVYAFGGEKKFEKVRERVERDLVDDRGQFAGTTQEYGDNEIADIEEQQKARETMLDRSEAVLKYFYQNGIDYHVLPDHEEGVLKLGFSSYPKKNVKILADPAHKDAGYVAARVYDEGIVCRFSVGQDEDAKDEDLVNVTPAQCVELMKYSMGETALRSDGKPIGINPNDINDLNPRSSVNVTYKTGSSGKAAFMAKCDTGPQYGQYNTLYMRIESNKSADKFRIGFTDRTDKDGNVITGEDKADKFLKDSIALSINNFNEAVKLDAVEQLAKDKAAGKFEGDIIFDDDNKLVYDTQKSYFDTVYSIYMSDEPNKSELTEQARLGLEYDIAQRFGDAENRQINVAYTSVFMNDTNGTASNRLNLLNALKKLRGTDREYGLVKNSEDYDISYVNDMLVKYNDKPVYDETGKQIYPKDIFPGSPDFKSVSPFWRNIAETVDKTLTETGVHVTGINVDEHGIINYQGTLVSGQLKAKAATKTVNGYIGQIFEPDMSPYNENGEPNIKQGLIKTNFNSGRNYYAAPGYRAIVIPNVNGEYLNYAERTRLMGYEQQLAEALKTDLRLNVATATVSAKYSDVTLDNSTALNSVYKHMYQEHYPLDFEETMTNELGLSKSRLKALIETQCRRVRYENVYRDETNLLTANRIDNKKWEDGLYTTYDKVGRQIMANMDKHIIGRYFDTTITGTGRNQGIAVYLTADSKVNPDGSITPGRSYDSPLLAHKDFKYKDNVPPDRGIMAAMNAVHQSCTADGRTVNPAGKNIGEPIGVGSAFMSLGGYTQDDAFVVSSDFANTYMIRGKDGAMRPLKIGDKICDFSGNKGVISFIADRNADMSYYNTKPVTNDMTPTEKYKTRSENYAKETQRKIIELFKDNPTLDVVGAPYTAPSRFNGGTARCCIDNYDKANSLGMPTTLKIGDKTVDGGIGYASWMITDMPVDEKTHLYETEGGRNASSQLIAALAGAGAKDVIDDIYRYNNSAVAKTREMLITMGLDMSETGELRTEYKPHIVGKDKDGSPIYEKRNEYSITKLTHDMAGTPYPFYLPDRNRIHTTNINKGLNDVGLLKNGGFIDIPFELRLATGETTPPVLDKNGKPTGEYRLPVLSGKYRSNTETIDDEVLVHEYTAAYTTICHNAVDYISRREFGRDKTTKDAKVMTDLVKGAQRAYNQIAEDIKDRWFEGKHNIFKEGIMKKQLHNTSTAVISPDPTLGLDEIAMSTEMAETLGIAGDKNPQTIIWRDPVLSPGGIRYFKAKLIETRPDKPGYDPNNPFSSLTGIAMNPSSATSFEGDFDGDSVGMYGLQTEKAKKCARRTLSAEAQLLNTEMVVDKDGEKKHVLYYQDKLDVASGLHADDQKGGKLRANLEKAAKMANDAYEAGDRSIDKDSVNREAYKLVNKTMHDIHKEAFGQDIQCFKDVESHIKAIEPMIESGAKGNMDKLKDYCKYFGAKITLDEDGHIDTVTDIGQSYATDEDRAASFRAVHAKADLTGVGGKALQHALISASKEVEAGRMPYEDAYAAATALTHPVTQAILQIKHDSPDEICRKTELISTVNSDIWKGYMLNSSADGKNWSVDLDEYKKPRRAGPEYWKNNFVDFYTKGLKVDEPAPKHMDAMAKMMTVVDEEHYDDRPRIHGYDAYDRYWADQKPNLTQLAYECKFDTVKKACKLGTNLFEGEIGKVIAPLNIRHNQAEYAKYQEDNSYVPNYDAVSAKDTQCINNKCVASVNLVSMIMKDDKEHGVVTEIDYSDILKGHYKRALSEPAADKSADVAKTAPVQTIAETVAEPKSDEPELNGANFGKQRPKFVAQFNELDDAGMKNLADTFVRKSQAGLFKTAADYTPLEKIFQEYVKDGHDMLRSDYSTKDEQVKALNENEDGQFTAYIAYYKAAKEFKSKQPVSMAKRAEQLNETINRTANISYASDRSDTYQP